MIANDVGLAEKRQSAGEEVVEIRGHDQSGQALLTEEVGQAEVGVGDGLACNQLLEVSLPLDRLREGPFKPVRVSVQR